MKGSTGQSSLYLAPIKQEKKSQQHLVIFYPGY